MTAADAADDLTDPPAAFEFLGAEFHCADRFDGLTLLRFGKLATQGVQADDMEGVAAIYDLLRTVIAEQDWVRFERHCAQVRPSMQQLAEVALSAGAAASDRPTKRQPSSSPGPAATTGGSRVVSFSKGTVTETGPDGTEARSSA